MNIIRFEDIEIWQEARELCKLVFKITSIEPFSKDFRFRDQIRDACGSIMDNIAEGFERDGHKEFIQFLFIAKASCGETRSQAYRAFDANFIAQEDLDNLLNRTHSIKIKTLGMINYLKKSDHKGSKFKV